MREERLSVRDAVDGDLDAINAVVAAAVMTWSLPERVKRLSLPAYRYHVHDLHIQRIRVAQRDGGEIVGVSATEPADPRDVPDATKAVMLHGLYVDPAAGARGVGTALLRDVVEAARRAGSVGVLVRAQREAAGFFEGRGFVRIVARSPSRRYPFLYWLSLGVGAEDPTEDD